MPTTIRKKMNIHVLKGRSLLRGALCIVAAGLAFRLFSLSSLGAALDAWMLRAGENPSFVTAMMDFELKGWPGGRSSWLDLLSSESALLAAWLPQADTVTATPGETVPEQPTPVKAPVLSGESFAPPFLTPEELQASPPPTASPAPLPDGIMEVSFNPSGGDGYDESQGVYIKNETSLTVDAAALMDKAPSVKLAGEGPQILIVHTHGSEAFRPDAEFPYTPTDVERTEDTRYNVVRVGDEMQKVFEAQGLRVLHDRSIYDEPSYSGSYGRSLSAIEKAIKDNPGISVVIDLHRDSIQTADGTIYAPVAEVSGQKVAQLMLLIGTNDSGLNHPHWKKNLTLAMHLQKCLNDAYPGLMRPINLRRERFNMHATTGSMLLEVGSSGNTLGEAIASARLFAEVTGTYLRQLTMDN